MRDNLRDNRQVRFSNNTKKSNATNNYRQLPNTYLNNLQIRIPVPDPIHEENAHLFAKVTASHSNPDKMAKDFYYLYYPQPLSTADYRSMMELVGSSNMPESQKERIIQHLRYERAMAKLKKTYANLQK